MTLVYIVLLVSRTLLTKKLEVSHTRHWDFYLSTYGFWEEQNLLHMVTSIKPSYMKKNMVVIIWCISICLFSKIFSVIYSFSKPSCALHPHISPHLNLFPILPHFLSISPMWYYLCSLKISYMDLSIRFLDLCVWVPVESEKLKCDCWWERRN